MKRSLKRFVRATGPMSRLPASERRYSEHKKQTPPASGCTFCAITKDATQWLDSSAHCVVIENSFGYDIWDGCRVDEHLMILPKRHVVSLADLPKKEQNDYMNLMASYEAKGYSLYARSPDNITKSVAHQHMHLLKIHPVRKKWLFYVRKPHILVTK